MTGRSTRFLAAFAFLGLLGILPACPSKLANAITKPAVTLSATTPPADSLKATVSWLLKDVPGLAPLDSIVVHWNGQNADGTPATKRERLAGSATSATSFWPSPNPGFGIQVAVCVFPYGKGVLEPSADNPVLCTSTNTVNGVGLPIRDVMSAPTATLVRVP